MIKHSKWPNFVLDLINNIVKVEEEERKNNYISQSAHGKADHCSIFAFVLVTVCVRARSLIIIIIMYTISISENDLDRQNFNSCLIYAIINIIKKRMKMKKTPAKTQYT